MSVRRALTITARLCARFGDDESYLFDARHLLDELRQINVRIGLATSVRKRQWSAAEDLSQ